MPFYGTIAVIKRNGIDGSLYPLTARQCIFGSGQNCDVRVILPSVAEAQCELKVTPSKDIYLTNMNGEVSTILDGRELEVGVATKLKDGDVFSMADRSFRYNCAPQRQSISVARKFSLIPRISTSKKRANKNLESGQIEAGEPSQPASTKKDKIPTPKVGTPKVPVGTPRLRSTQRKENRASVIKSVSTPNLKRFATPQILKSTVKGKVYNISTQKKENQGSALKSILTPNLKRIGTPLASKSTVKGKVFGSAASTATGVKSVSNSGVKSMPKSTAATLGGRSLLKRPIATKTDPPKEKIVRKELFRTRRRSSVPSREDQNDPDIPTTVQPDLDSDGPSPPKILKLVDISVFNPKVATPRQSNGGPSGSIDSSMDLFSSTPAARKSHPINETELMKFFTPTATAPEQASADDTTLVNGTDTDGDCSDDDAVEFSMEAAGRTPGTSLMKSATRTVSNWSQAISFLNDDEGSAKAEKRQSTKSVKFTGVKKLFKQKEKVFPTPRFAGTRRLFEKSKNENTESPKIAGVADLFKGEKNRKSPRLAGIKELFNEKKKDVVSPRLAGVSRLFLEEDKDQKSPRLGGVSRLLRSGSKEQQPSPRLVGILRNKVRQSPRLAGVSRLFKESTPAQSPKLAGIGYLLRGRKLENSPNLSGIAQLFPEEVTNSPPKKRQRKSKENVSIPDLSVGRVLRNRTLNSTANSAIEVSKASLILEKEKIPKQTAKEEGKAENEMKEEKPIKKKRVAKPKSEEVENFEEGETSGGKKQTKKKEPTKKKTVVKSKVETENTENGETSGKKAMGQENETKENESIPDLAIGRVLRNRTRNSTANSVIEVSKASLILEEEKKPKRAAKKKPAAKTKSKEIENFEESETNGKAPAKKKTAAKSESEMEKTEKAVVETGVKTRKRKSATKEAKSEEVENEDDGETSGKKRANKNKKNESKEKEPAKKKAAAKSKVEPEMENTEEGETSGKGRKRKSSTKEDISDPPVGRVLRNGKKFAKNV